MNLARFRRTTVLATLLLILEISALLFAAVQGLRDPVEQTGASGAVWVLSFIAFPVMGWIIAVRLPKSPLGWIYLTFPIVVALGVLLQELALLGALGGNEAAAAVIMLFGAWIFVAGIWLILVPGVLLFPDGRLPGYRWRWALRGLAIALLAVGVMGLFGNGRVCIDWSAEVVNECIRWAENPLNPSALSDLGENLDQLLNVLLFLGAIVALAGLITRYRRSRGEVRQQIKWVTVAAMAGILPFVLMSAAQEAFGLSLNEWVGVAPFVLLNVGLPVAIAVAIFKYRLYEIDRIISRTASYALVAAVLAAVYVAGVTVTQRISPVQNQFGIVVSTLVVAALFNPLRQRVLTVVDRRFNRSRYDARRVLDDFSTQLRDDVDLEQMQAALLGAAQETLQPSHLSLWVREPES